METERLRLAHIQNSDTDFIIDLLNTPGWIKYIGDRNVHSEAAALQYIEKITAQPNNNYFVVQLKATSTPIGVLSFMQRTHLDDPDIGFAFLPQYHNNGYAFEATHFYISHLKNEKKHTKIVAITLPENLSSIRLLTKLGLQFEAPVADETVMLHLYSMQL